MTALRSMPAVAVALAAGLCACGGSHAAVAVRVGSSSIAADALAARITSVAPGHVALEPPRFKRCIAYFEAQNPGSIAGAAKEECSQQYEALLPRELGALISSHWLIGEASERGVALQGGTLAAKAHAAESRIREALRATEPKPTPAQMTAYYEQNVAQFGRPEQRYLDIVERIPTKAAAKASLDAVRRRGGMHAVSLHETFTEEDLARVVPWKRAILEAIFAAAPHTLVGPLPLNKQWCFFEITRVIPRDVKPLAQVRGSIEQALGAEHERRELVPFIAAWRKKWIARTYCSPGYVVQKCREYRGPSTPEDPTTFD